MISHGTFADGLKMSAEMICGKQDELYSKCMLVGEHPSKYIQEIEDGLLTDGENIILADLFGGSMCNEAMKLLKYDNVFLASGMSLPLVVEVLFSSIKNEDDLKTIIENTKNAQKLVSVEKKIDEEIDEDFF